MNSGIYWGLFMMVPHLPPILEDLVLSSADGKMVLL